jgi:lipopolysaccharide transport system ATP-binding protein
MSSDSIAISVKNLSKKYTISGPQEQYLTLRDAIVNSVKAPFRRFNRAPPDEGFWALKDVSFDVELGEVVGIIGRNGAGKSTLLKILSRIASPTEGTVELYGRVGSLLEVGTGFHPELTGRENIFLSGSILGMKRQEIDQKLDEIVAFSEIEKFLETPVKRYSSGMYVRLAFAVAAHLDTEILLIDEVLAVGDASFQKKCLGKMGEVAKHGRTVLFVSHNMQAVRSLCSTGIIIDHGTATEKKEAGIVIREYLESLSTSEDNSDFDKILTELPQDQVFKWEEIELRQNNITVYQTIENGSPLEIIVHYSVKQKTQGLRVFFDLCDTDDTLLFRSFHDEQNEGIPLMYPGHYTSSAIIPADLLSPRSYELRLFSTIFNERICPPVDGIRIVIHVERTGKTNSAYLSEPIRGRLAPFIRWETVSKNNQVRSSD